MTFIAGHYTLTYGGSSLGIIEDALELELQHSVDEIRGDPLGDTIIDGVYRGGNMYLNFVLQEADAAGVAALIWPYNATFGVVGTPGVLMTSVDAALVMTQLAGTTSTPASLTFTSCILAPNFPIRMLYGTRLRNIPIRMLCMPFVDTVNKWYS